MRTLRNEFLLGKNNFTFPNILFTIALVIERKKLSPEARKQTSASESFKITSKNRFYVCRHLSIPNNYFFICCPLFICLSVFSHYKFYTLRVNPTSPLSAAHPPSQFYLSLDRCFVRCFAFISGGFGFKV